MRYLKWTGLVTTILCLGIFLASFINETNRLDISAWVVDWDLRRGQDELLLYDWSSIQYFAVYFNEEDELIVDDKLEASFCENGGSCYLTIVNDIKKQDGSSIQKDSALVDRLLNNENHVDDLVCLANELEVVGLELDYEKIPDELWEDYVDFIERLGNELKANGKQLRIVLEPRSPIDRVQLPSDYEYVMMAYNLYGYHSGPGPKADLMFISDLVRKVKSHLSDVRVAFSLGGFDWTEGEKPRAVTMSEAQMLASKMEASYQRDDQSGALYFRYMDDLNQSHEVWFADEVTIETWIKEAQKEQINQFALWRLGGNQ